MDAEIQSLSRQIRSILERVCACLDGLSLEITRDIVLRESQA